MKTLTPATTSVEALNAAWVPPMVTPGAEAAALARFHWDCEWTGTIEPNMMGPGSPEMSAIGRATFAWTDDGLWLRGEFEQDQFAGGRLALTWKAHYLVGWDPLARDYVAFLADNCGHAGFMRGSIDGDRLVLETTAGGPVRFRITWDLSDATAPSWIDEVSVAGGPWQFVERYVLTPHAEHRGTVPPTAQVVGAARQSRYVRALARSMH